MRDYGEVVRRVEALEWGYVKRRVLCEVEGDPVFGVTLSQGAGRPAVLLNGGTHGDEPAGVEAVLRVLERDVSAWLEWFDVEVVPCLNPYGYVHETRHNGRDVDLNWGYEDESLVEIAAMKKLVEGRRFVFVFDCHEDWESPGFYFYDVRRNGESVGARVIKAVEAICPINRADEIEGAPADNGVIRPDPELVAKVRGAGLPIALFRDHTDHFMTTETPTGLDLEERVRAQLTALEVVAAEHMELLRSG